MLKKIFKLPMVALRKLTGTNRLDIAVKEVRESIREIRSDLDNTELSYVQMHILKSLVDEGTIKSSGYAIAATYVDYMEYLEDAGYVEFKDYIMEQVNERLERYRVDEY